MKREMVFWSTSIFLLLIIVLARLINQEWARYVLAICAGFYLAGNFAALLWRR